MVPGQDSVATPAPTLEAADLGDIHIEISIAIDIVVLL